MNTKFPTVSPSTIGREEKNFFFTSSSLQIEWYWKKIFHFIFSKPNKTWKFKTLKSSSSKPLPLGPFSCPRRVGPSPLCQVGTTPRIDYS